MRNTPSKAAVKKARLNRLFKEQKERDGYLDFIKATGSEVLFRYGGHLIHFTLREGRVTRGPETHIHLGDEDYVFLFSLAGKIMKMVQAGYKKNEDKAPKPPLDTRQGRLFP